MVDVQSTAIMDESNTSALRGATVDSPSAIDSSSSPANPPSSPQITASTRDKQSANSVSNSQATDMPQPTTTNASMRELGFKFGPYVPILRKDSGLIIDPKGIINDYSDTDSSAQSKRLACEVLPEDAILDAPSLVTPLLLKKKTKWPSKEVLKTMDKDSEANKSDANDHPIPEPEDSEVEIIEVKSKSSGTLSSSATDNNKTVEEYVKKTTIASLTHTAKTNQHIPILTIEDYYKSSAGELLLGIGLSLVNEFHIEDDCRRINSKIRRGENKTSNLIGELESARSRLVQARLSNKPYKSEQVLRCPHCYFKSNLQIVMDGHMEAPHMNGKREYSCNWCDYRVKDCNSIVFHNLVEHKKRCRIEKPLALHLCRFCPYECKSKRKLETHLNRCAQHFPQNIIQGPQEYGENDFPAITSKLITQQDIKTYEETLKAIRLAAYSPHQIQISGYQQGSNKVPLVVVPRQSLASNSGASGAAFASLIQPNNSVNVSLAAIGNPIGPSKNVVGTIRGNNKGAVAQASFNNSSQLLHLLASQQTANLNQNRSSVVHYPRPQSPFVNGRSVINSTTNIIMAPQNHPTSEETESCSNIDPQDDGLSPVSSPTLNPKGSTFVICEICDGYIKDLYQLKSHMQWTHKVKIHQKTLESRPPLNCQKCQWRFFTDQGLERHLLGAHGLVTSNMQELVDKKADSGRCTVCGRAYAHNLVEHMKEAHKTNLKPAHLSYKCTVCSATFNLYRLFENHVYSVHSDSVRRIPSN